MEELEDLVPKKELDTCCQSYKTAKGRCFDCPEHQEIEEEEWE